MSTATSTRVFPPISLSLQCSQPAPFSISLLEGKGVIRSHGVVGWKWDLMGTGASERKREMSNHIGSGLNVHLTEVGASRSTGVTYDAVGHYPGCDCSRASAIVAPGKFIQEYLDEQGLESTDEGFAQAVTAWAQTEEGQNAPTHRCPRCEVC